MRHRTPLAAFETLERELISLEEDVVRPGTMLAQRLETLLTLVPVLGAAAQEPAFAGERRASLAALERLQDRQAELEAALRAEMARVREAIIQASNGAAATRGYNSGSAAATQLDLVG